jgi:hypothetical protein
LFFLVGIKTKEMTMNCACGWAECWGEAECGTPQNEGGFALALLLSGGSLESLLLDCVEEDEEV